MGGRAYLTRLRERRDPLFLASLAFLVANLLHGIDHQRTGTERLTAEVSAGGFAITIAAVAILWLASRRYQRTPLLAAVVGLWSAALIASAHFAPHWSAFSDSYWDLSPDPFSWVVAGAEVMAGLVLGLVGLRELRRGAVEREAVGLR
jgi:hypothetical protein